MSGRSLDHTASPGAGWCGAVERRERVVDGVGAGLVLGIENVGVDGLPKGVVVVHHTVTEGLVVSSDTKYIATDTRSNAYKSLLEESVISKTIVVRPEVRPTRRLDQRQSPTPPALFPRSHLADVNLAQLPMNWEIGRTNYGQSCAVSRSSRSRSET